MLKNKTQTISVSTLVKKLLQNSCYLMTHLHIYIYIYIYIYKDLKKIEPPLNIP